MFFVDRAYQHAAPSRRVKHFAEGLASNPARSKNLVLLLNQARAEVSSHDREITLARLATQGIEMKIPEHVRTTMAQDGAVLLDIKRGHMVTLNPIGSIIWQQLADGRTPEQIVVLLATEFGVPQQQVSADVDEFLEQLEAQHLIESGEVLNRRIPLGPKPAGLFCNLFRWRNSQATHERGSKQQIL